MPKLSPEVAAILHAHLPPPGIDQNLLPPSDRDQDSSAGLAGGPHHRASERAASEVVQVLPWDFRQSFPMPLGEAVEAGKLLEEDLEPENLKALHEEHARHALAILSDLDAVSDAKRQGVDPFTGKAPRTETQRDRLQILYRNQPGRLERAFETLMDVYEEVFGPEATDAFRKAICAWHAGIEVAADSASVMHRTTGQLTEDFDQSTGVSVTNQTSEEFSYEPDHPWHYYARGDGADPIPLAEIPAGEARHSIESLKLPKDRKKRTAKLSQLLTDHEGSLREDEERYLKLIARGVDELSEYDRNIAYGGDLELVRPMPMRPFGCSDWPCMR